MNKQNNTTLIDLLIQIRILSQEDKQKLLYFVMGLNAKNNDDKTA